MSAHVSRRAVPAAVNAPHSNAETTPVAVAISDDHVVTLATGSTYGTRTTTNVATATIAKPQTTPEKEQLYKIFGEMYAQAVKDSDQETMDALNQRVAAMSDNSLLDLKSEGEFE